MMELSIFHEKLNKVDGNAYVIEEEIHMPASGIYDEELQHDNIADNTLAVYTGPMLTGEQIQTYALSTPSAMPWKRKIRIQSDVPVVYITYETTGDTVEADDINRVQDAIVKTQGGVNAEAARAISAEEELTRNLQAEAERAAGEEQRLDSQIGAEVARAQEAEEALSHRLDAEVARAETAEQVNTDAIAAEASRAAAAEKVLTDNLDYEIERARNVEQQISGDLAAEVSRAEEAERILSDNLSDETARAKLAEKVNADSITEEASRAKAREGELQGGIDAHVTAVNGEVQALKAADTALDEKKANVSDVNRELADRYTKSQVFTKEEVLQKIEDLIGTAPDTLDTFKEIADALGNDPNFAATIMNLLAGKVDKEAGKQLTSNDYSNSEKAIVADVNAKKHSHNNKSVLDKVTQSLIDAWNAAYTHISDTVKHVTVAERNNWDDANSKKHTHSNKGVIDKLTQAMLDKLSGIAAGAEVNVQPDWSITDTASDAYIKNKPSAMPASDVKAWAKAETKPAYSWTEITGKPSAYAPSAHNHTKSQITDMPSKLSQFTNDAGYITAADVDTSQNHTHTNKGILDNITQTMINTWNTVTNKVDKVTGKGLSTNDFTSALLSKLNGIAEGANKYVHPVTSGNKHIPAGGASGQILKWKADGDAEWGADSNSDTKVTQTNTTGSADYRMVLSGNANDTTETNTARKSANFLANPATGELYAKGFRRINITGQTLNINILNLSAGAPCIMRYIEKTSGGAANITNIPVTGQPFLLDVELIRWASATDYITMQTFRNAANPANEYVRFCTSGTWNNWVTRVFTDTKYTHPNSGVSAGTYKSVTVNAQGHVTGGSNPSTLAGYGITDAAAKNHNHDTMYLKKGAVTWNDLKGS